MQWVASYKDKTYLKSSEGAAYRDIDREKLERFSLISDDQRVIYTLWLDPGQCLIYRRRVFKTVQSETVWYLVGWQQTIQGRNVQSIAYLSEDGLRVNLAGKFREDHPLFYSVEYIPEELDVHDLG